MLASSCIAFAMVAIFFIASAFTEHSARDLRAKQVNLMIRQIGHRLQLQAGDLTSRVMPVTENEKGTFLLQFENKFVFNHDSLMALSRNLLPKTEFPSGYTVTVHDCIKSDIIYGFQINNSSPDILACSGRIQPVGCYSIEFAFADFYKNIEQKEPGTNPLTTLAKVDPQEMVLKPEEIKTIPFETVVYCGIMLLGVALLIGISRFGKAAKPLPMQEQSQVVINDCVPEYPALGKFLFDVKGQRLLLGGEMTRLTDKECKVLELLYKNFGELMLRETLMQKVWIDEGVITGRSLDMFVSKLRKKLSPDPELRITNVHGKGYKLEEQERQII
jgi:DNA-binding winged helix-turn-helix (wHTH) protein